VTTDRRPELAEGLGVFLLVLVGCGAIMTNAVTGALGLVGIALAFAFVILVLIYAMGHICGAHYNPAITLAFAITGHFPWRRVPTYWLAQLAGATLAALTLRALFGNIADLGATASRIGLWQAYAVEVLATFILALVIIGVATDKRAAPGIAGIAIGLTVGLDALAFGPLTGASMNPARSLGPALASGALGDIWLYLTAPLVGAALGMLAYEGLRRGRLGIAAREPLGALGPIEGLEERA
jgi:MIP family channel proteins